MITGTLDTARSRPAHLGARQTRQHEVEQHDIGAVPLEVGQRVRGRSPRRDLVALLAQHVRQGVAVALFVFDHEYAGHDGAS
jgi:hypothetical protein